MTISTADLATLFDEEGASMIPWRSGRLVATRTDAGIVLDGPDGTMTIARGTFVAEHAGRCWTRETCDRLAV